MDHRIDYYAGRDLLYPNKPTKPKLEKDHTPAAARSYADDLEQYERDLENYKDDLNYYNDQHNLRLKEFQDQLRDDFGLTQAQFNVIWHHAWDRGHSSGLQEVYHYFTTFYDMASEFAALEKG